ncbi:hypothetical protein DL96DRAFT_494994 [Flagelloscypha sp. PMI_526]|nr:hypothetical protein DL96DRAFT_494994 [Flagelloscypha sp. PMI_526]
MVSLPLDIIPQILEHLPVADLESCSLVDTSFRTFSQEIIFSQHLVLCSKTWRAKCLFLLGVEGRRLFMRVKNLTLRMEGMPGVTFSSVDLDPDLLDFIEKIGCQLDNFSLSGKEHTSCISWSLLFPSGFHNILCYKVLPYIHFLRLEDFESVPWVTILNYCRHLQSIVIDAPCSAITSEETAALRIKRPSISSLTVGRNLKNTDFSLTMSLGLLLNHPDCKITFLDLSESYYWKIASQLNVLSTLKSLRANLEHLSLGLDMYDLMGQSLFFISVVFPL